MELEDRDIPIPINRRAEQEAEEILVEGGFAESEEMEPEMAELLNEMSRRIRGMGLEELHQLLSRYEWVRKAMFDDNR